LYRQPVEDPLAGSSCPPLGGVVSCADGPRGSCRRCDAGQLPVRRHPAALASPPRPGPADIRPAWPRGGPLATGNRLRGRPGLRGPAVAGAARRITLFKDSLALLDEHWCRAQRAQTCGATPMPDAHVFSFDPAGRQPTNPDSVTHRFGRLADQLEDLRKGIMSFESAVAMRFPGRAQSELRAAGPGLAADRAGAPLRSRSDDRCWG
jgi:hypothetical protein